MASPRLPSLAGSRRNVEDSRRRRPASSIDRDATWTTSDAGPAARQSWRAAEARLYPLAMTDVDGYQRALVLVGAPCCDELRAEHHDVRAICSRAPSRGRRARGRGVRRDGSERAPASNSMTSSDRRRRPATVNWPRRRAALAHGWRPSSAPRSPSRRGPTSTPAPLGLACPSCGSTSAPGGRSSPSSVPTPTTGAPVSSSPRLVVDLADGRAACDEAAGARSRVTGRRRLGGVRTLASRRPDRTADAAAVETDPSSIVGGFLLVSRHVSDGEAEARPMEPQTPPIWSLRLQAAGLRADVRTEGRGRRRRARRTSACCGSTTTR